MSILFFSFYFYLFLAVLGLHCCLGAFSSCGEQGLLSSCSSWAFHCGGFSCCGTQAQGGRFQYLQYSGSVLVAHGLSCPRVCGVFPDQGLNLCCQHWQVHSYKSLNILIQKKLFFKYINTLHKDSLIHIILQSNH